MTKATVTGIKAAGVVVAVANSAVHATVPAPSGHAATDIE
jgi:hypothetical protein